MSQYKTKKFEKLQKEWYDKLKADGFEDIEATETEYTLRTTAPTFAFVPKVVADAKLAYSSMADRFLNEYDFKNDLEKTIWEYHANGLGCRAIANTLLKLKLVKKTNRTTVWQVIKRLQEAMKRAYIQYDHNEEH